MLIPSETDSSNLSSKNEAESQQKEPGHVPLGANLLPPIVKKEIGGPKGLEPTRYGDWEKNGRCIDF